MSKKQATAARPSKERDAVKEKLAEGSRKLDEVLERLRKGAENLTARRASMALVKGGQ